MKRFWIFLKELAGDILWLGLGVVFSLLIIALVIVVVVLVYNGVLLDGSNPRFGG